MKDLSRTKLLSANLGTIGHVDHGKTMMTAAIEMTQIEAKKMAKAREDVLLEEKERGVVISRVLGEQGDFEPDYA